MIKVYYNATVVSLDSNDRVYEAIAIDGERIIALGSSDALRSQYTNAVQTDLDGAVIYPAFADSHAHIFGTGERATKPRLEPATSLEHALSIVTQAVSNSSSDWIVLRGWDHNKWGMESFPTKHDLHGISDKPIVLTRVDGHATWLNQAALDAADIHRRTIGPSGGEILLHDDGDISGILLDEAMKLVESKIPKQSKNEIKSVMRAGLMEFAKHGNATVHDMGVPAHHWEVLQELYGEEGQKLPRAHVFLDMNQESGKQYFIEMAGNQQPATDNLKLVGIKIYLDGALGSRGAELFEEYTDDPGNFGLALSDDDEVIGLMQKAASMNMQIAVHAIGDKANHRALELFERSGAAGKTNCRIEHAQIVEDKDLSTYSRLGVKAVIQPPFFPSDRHWAIHRLGEERMRTAYRWRSLIEAGIETIASSDSPVEPPNTIEGIRTLVSRDGVQDGEGLREMDAIKLYSTEGAKLDGQIRERGTLEIGKLADLTILTKPVLDAGSRVKDVLLRGRVLYSESGPLG
jgi:predicted amidohydrolase YtcJ